MSNWLVSICVMVEGEADEIDSLSGLDKNLSKEDQLLKLRSEVENLHGQFTMDKLEFEQKEKLQNEAYNVGWISVCWSVHAKTDAHDNRDSLHPPS